MSDDTWKGYLKGKRGGLWVATLLVVIVFGVVFTGLIAYGEGFRGRVLPGVRVGDISLSGMSEPELREYLHTMQQKLIDTGIEVQLLDESEKKVVVRPRKILDDDFFELVTIDIDAEVAAFIGRFQNYGVLTRGFAALGGRVWPRQVTLHSVSVDTEGLTELIKEKITQYERQKKDATIRVVSLSPLKYVIEEENPGEIFDLSSIDDDIKGPWEKLQSPTISLKSIKQDPDVLTLDVELITNRLPQIIKGGTLKLHFEDPASSKNQQWLLTVGDIVGLLDVQKTASSTFVFGLSGVSTSEYIANVVAPGVDREPQEARFEIGGSGKVSEFVGSAPGLKLDVFSVYDQMNDAIIERNWHKKGTTKEISLVAQPVEPKVKTGEVNDLGISEVLGVGYSNYGGSPPNRIRNIRHAVKNKLHGLLIKPDETFSLLGALKPFTLEAGYLPELVIKGDKIEPEIGGGLCQIGSTVFRAVMNSGLPIVERRNHSLVVSYYNDPRNGLPGTDATIYENAPDFKFRNDTGHHVLLTTEMDERTADLRFTFWGTNDGRNGYYSEPKVSKWIPHGETEYIETLDLEPGEEECQGAHQGAHAAFTYYVERDDGTTDERVFESYYRPLPEICLVGVEELSEDGKVFDPSDDLVAPTS